MNDADHIRVIAYCGYRGDERPAAVVLDGERLEVTDIEDSWIAAGIDPRDEVRRGFVVRCLGGVRLRIICRDDTGWTGEIIPGPRLTIEPK